jgi:hypothetical protein
MSRSHLVLGVLMAAAAAACGGAPSTPVAPTSAASTDASAASSGPTALTGPCVIDFAGLQVNDALFDRHTACGVTITTERAPWQVSTTYGSPAPFIQFKVAGATTLIGDVVLHSADGAFTFDSVDIYSSTTKIPYEITGTSRGAVAFTLTGVQGNTFGRLATILNTHAAIPVDTLRLSLTNAAAPCCANPVGLDNVRIAR